MKAWWIAAVLLAIGPSVAVAQSTELAAACAEVQSDAQPTCLVVAQAVESAQPQLGMLITSGNPTLGTATISGLRMGVLPRLNVSIKANLVYARLPDVRSLDVGPSDVASYGDLVLVAPAFAGTASLGIYPGLSVAPTVGGIGSLALLGNATWLPLRRVGSDFWQSSADIAYGGGVRLGLLGESFTTPGISVSTMYNHLGKVSYGQICSLGVTTSTTDGPGYTLEEGQCAPTNRGNIGEFSFDLDNWSSRAVISKHLLGLGLAAGLGYDSYSSALAAGLRAPDTGIAELDGYYARVGDVELSQHRWSGFVDASFSVVVTSFAIEAGWQQGSDPIAGYPASAEFDPTDGSFFGSVGVRVAL